MVGGYVEFDKIILIELGGYIGNSEYDIFPTVICTVCISFQTVKLQHIYDCLFPRAMPSNSASYNINSHYQV